MQCATDTLQHTATHCNTPQQTNTSIHSSNMHTDTLQRTATHCNTLRHTATSCNKPDTSIHSSNMHTDTLQCTSTHCDALQRIATHCHTLQRTATHPIQWYTRTIYSLAHRITQQHTATHYIPRYVHQIGIHTSTLRHTATHCNTPHTSICTPKRHSHGSFVVQHPATHCNTLQHTAAHCNTIHDTAAHKKRFTCATHTQKDLAQRRVGTATHCNIPQHTKHAATHCRRHTLQTPHIAEHPTCRYHCHDAKQIGIQTRKNQTGITWSNTYKYRWAHLSDMHIDALQHTATHCNTLQHTATWCIRR